jgi:non-specific serine/threonine protein kinase/serine/threonine-protein kinase
MTPEEWQEIKEIFQSAIERDKDQRAAFVAEACAGNIQLSTEVERLIALHEQAGDFIETPLGGLDLDLLGAAREQAGRRIGAYELMREIGHGGMGAVYLAVRADQQYQKRVAIKLVNRGMDSEGILRRFRNERQILASLDHPNIAKLLDGGTTDDNLPYFVMDYIEGAPINQYCDDHRLSTVERLALFRTVCSAVHYAHQNLVVHRDIKPSNILITADGTPKLVDFGIAKLMNPELTSIDQTLTMLGPMTPAYASPEQVRGGPITTASDVYSLGVLLYELLTGHPPYRFKSRDPQEIAQVICDREPPRPSTAVGQVETLPDFDNRTQISLTPEIVSKTREGEPDKLRRKLEGDLDNIVLMAMRKEPRRRYASAEQFSDDIRRHLEGLPVIARKDTPGYRSTKFIKRNKVLVVAAILIVLTLLSGIVATTWEAHVATSQKARAERRFNDVRRLANSFMFELNDEIAKEPTKARGLLVKRALEYLDSLAQEAGDDPSLQRELATAYEKVGDILGNPYSANLGDTAGAIESYRKALAIRQALSAAEPASTDVRRDLAISYGRMGEMQEQTGDIPGALESQRRSLEVREGLLSQEPANMQASRDLSRSYESIGDLLDKTNDAAGALANYRKSLAILESLSTTAPGDAQLRRSVAVLHTKVGFAQSKTGDKTGALENLRKSVTDFESLVGGDPGNLQARGDLAYSYGRLGDLLGESDDLDGALENYRKALSIREALRLADPADERARRAVAADYGNVGYTLAQMGKTVEAVETYRKSVPIFEALSAANPANAAARRDLAICYAYFGDVYKFLASRASDPVVIRVEHWQEARSWYRRSLDVRLDMRNRGTLRASDADEPDKLASEIAACDAELAKLRAR